MKHLVFAIVLSFGAFLYTANCVAHESKDGCTNGISNERALYTHESEEEIDTIPQNGKKNDEGEIFVVVEQMPHFPGGQGALMKYLAHNIHYPKEAKDAQLQGRVMVKFVIEKDGSITNACVVRSIGPSLDNEALRVINSMPKWKPGMQRGVPVRVYFTVPIMFRL